MTRVIAVIVLIAVMATGAMAQSDNACHAGNPLHSSYVAMIGYECNEGANSDVVDLLYRVGWYVARASQDYFVDEGHNSRDGVEDGRIRVETRYFTLDGYITFALDWAGANSVDPGKEEPESLATNTEEEPSS